MDDTQTSRVSDAAATRKRRSSILKSQRPPRTPFSDLEFNVATPTDTAKSRRVSFSRRTGVAEFATNEATTTWKNFYEEHNRSLESSENEASKQIGFIGKRIFDQQFEVVEADCVGIHAPGHLNKSLSLNNFGNQLLSIDRTEELKLTDNHSIMNLTTLTSTNTNLFGEPAMPSGEVTDRIDINFSNIQPIGNDDLDDIENDLKQNFQGSFKRQNMSEYIEVDLDMTQAALCNDDMSITDTVHSPEVLVPINVGNSDGNLKLGQNDDLDVIQKDLNILKHGREMSLSQSINSLKALDFKTKLIDDNCKEDKENTAVNPYAPIKETENFAVKEEDKVLVFDGKRLTLQADIPQEPLPPKPIENAQRKTIVLNFNDDLPNFVDIPHTTGIEEVEEQLQKSLVLEDIKEPVLDTNKRSIIFDEDQGNITITQVMATNIVSEDKRRTIHYDDSEGNISMTQALPTKIAEIHRTVVYDDEGGDMSITAAFPTNILSAYGPNEKRNPMVFIDRNMCITHAPSNIIPETTKKPSIFVEDTEVISKILSNENQNQKTDKRSTVFYEDDNCNFSLAQAIPSINSIVSQQSSDRRRTVVIEADTGNISIAQAVPSVIIPEKVKEASIEAAEKKNIESQREQTRRRTIVYDDDAGDLSLTESVPNHILKTNVVQKYDPQKCLSTEAESNDDVTNTANSDTNKRKTIVLENHDADITLTQAVSVNQVLCAMRDENINQTIKSGSTSNEVTTTPNSDTNKRKTIVFENDDADISMTQAVSANQVLCAMRDENINQTIKSGSTSNEVTTTPNSDTNKRKTIVFENDDADISMTQAVSANQVLCAMRDENINQTIKSGSTSNEVTTTPNSDINKRKTIVFENDDADISMTQAVSVNQVLCAIMRNENKDQTTNNVHEHYPEPDLKKSFVNNFYNDISITQAVPTNVIECFNLSIHEITKKATNSNNCDKRCTVVFEPDEGDISMTHVVNSDPIVQEPGNGCHGQDGPTVQEALVLEGTHEVLHNKKDRGHRTVIYEEHENVFISENQQSEIEHAPSTSIKGNILEQTNTVYNDVSSATNSLAEMVVEIQNKDKNKHLSDQDTSEILNMAPMMDTINPVINVNADAEKRFDMSSRNEIKKVIRKTLSAKQSMTSKTNLSLDRIQNDLEESIKNEMTNLIRENYNEAEVFPTLCPRTQQDDTIGADFDATIFENLSSTSKADNDGALKQTEKVVASEMHSNKMDNIELQNENKSPRKIPNDNTSVSQVSEKTSVRSKSILNELLDMSTSVNEKLLTGLPNGERKRTVSEVYSDEGGIFVITHDQKEIKSQTDNVDDTPQLIVPSPLPLEYKDKSNNQSLPFSQKIQKKLHNVKEVLAKSTNKTLDKIRAPILKVTNKVDGARSESVTIIPGAYRGHLALENKYEAEPEAKQSFVPRRQSIAISREDLLNNLSMAGEALKTQIVFDEEDLEDSPESDNSPMNDIRRSNEVVKTLQFDESATEPNLFQKLSSPLQKAAFGENSYMHDYKTNVIPPFTTVSEGIKELMDDLVKPNSDVLPFDCTLADKATTKVSTHSTQIQANIVTSSQVELLGLASESFCDLDVDRISSTDLINEAVDRSVSRALKFPIKQFTAEASGKVSETEVKKCVRIISPHKRTECPSRVLVFDHFNPLNNILLAPKMMDEAHAYNPVQAEEGTVSESNSVQMSLYEKTVELTENVTMQYNVSNVNCMKQSGDSSFNKSICFPPGLSSRLSLVSKPPSIDQSTEVIKEKDLKSATVNTLIAMKANIELLEDDSSLTLVDDALARSSFDITKTAELTSAMKVLFSSYTKDDVLCDIDSEHASNEVIKKSKKRGRDISLITNRPTVNRASLHKPVDLTPKPNKKMPKLSESPYTVKATQSQNLSAKSQKCNKIAYDVQKLVTKKEGPSISPVSVQDSDRIGSKSAVSSLEPSQSASHSWSGMDADSSEVESSCASSNNLRDDMSRGASSNSSKVSKMDFQPDVLSNAMGEDESSTNVGDMIEKLPFMGTECEWESRSDDMWSFRMLHRRIRLMLRLQQRYDAAWRVPADAAVQYINVEIVEYDSKNVLASVCVRFAVDTMQWFVNRGCPTTRAVPALVRQCAAAARLAARWGRFMSEARHHLAYSLTPRGLVTLKVANIPLRCVWEVSLQLRLTHTSKSAAPWVEASDVTVRRVMSCAPVFRNDDPAPLLRDLPSDWSHAPRAIWKIFKYLKNMTRKEDDELFMT